MDQERLLTLLEGYIENTLTDSERSDLERAVVESPQAARTFWEYVQQHAWVWELKAEARGRALAATPQERLLERIERSVGLSDAPRETGPTPLPEVPVRPLVPSRSGRVRFHRSSDSGKRSLILIGSAAALFVAFVAIVMNSTLRTPPSAAKSDRTQAALTDASIGRHEVELKRLSGKGSLTAAEREALQRAMDAQLEHQISGREEEIRRQKEKREQVERERLKRQAELEAIVASRQKQEEALRQALESRKEEEQKKAREEIRRIDEQKQKVTDELERAKENERKVEASVAAQVIAHLDRVKGRVFLVDGPTRTAAKAGMPVGLGQGIETVGFDSRCTVRYVDKTRVELDADAKVREFTEREAGGGGKRVHLLRGSVTAEVKKQPAGRPMIFGTPHGEATVLGTTLRLVVDGLATRLEVTEGKVRLTRTDGKSVEVPGNHFTVAVAGSDLVIRKPLVAEDFEDSQTVDAQWRLLLMGKDFAPAFLDGKVQVSLLKSSTKGNVQGELHSRLAYPAPMRVSMDVELSHQHSDLLAGFRFVPAESEPKRDNKDAILCTMAGTRRSLSFGDGNWRWTGLQNTGVNAPTPRRESWLLELEGDEVRVFIDGKQTFLQKHGRKVHTHYHLCLEGTALAGPSLPAGAFVRFDNVRVEPLTR